MTPHLPEIDVSQIPSYDDRPPYLLDVRENDEWAAAHIEGAMHIPMMQVPARFAELPTDEQILVICRSGSRSAQVVDLLQAHGLDAVNVAGGMKAWSAQGLPMTGPPGMPPRVI